MSRPDPFDLLVAANPVPDLGALRVPPSRRGRRYRVALAGVGVLAVASAAAAAFLASRPPTRTQSVGCYAEARLDADAAVVTARPGQAVAACADLWAEGEVGPGPVPPLQACVLRDGAVGVFPGADGSVCAGLGNSSAPAADPPAAAPDVAGLRDELSAATRGQRCVLPADARAVAEAALRRHGAGDWAIEVGEGANGAGFDESRPCAGFAIEEPRQAVILVPMPVVGTGVDPVTSRFSGARSTN